MKLKYPNKLEAGMKCVDLLTGKVCGVSEHDSVGDYPFAVRADGPVIATCFVDGRVYSTHKNPLFLTLENAEALG